MRLLAVSILLAASLASASPVDAVPKPAVGHWVSDAAGALSPEVRQQVDAIGSAVNAAGQGQLAVVVIDSTDGASSREYATALFNRWGVGHAAVNDGVLLLIAMKDRRAEIILGRGIDSPDSKAVTDRIMQDDVEASMKRGDLNAAVLDSVTALRAFLADAATARNVAPVPVVPAASTTGADRQRSVKQGALSAPTTPASSELPTWAWILGSVGLVGAGGGLIKWRSRYVTRKCVQCGRPCVRLDETEEDDFLTRGEQAEESVESVDYDVWYCRPCDKAQIIPYPRWFSGRTRCPRCGFQTNSSRELTVVGSTSMSYGRVEILEQCANCRRTKKRVRKIPPLLSNTIIGSSGSSGSSFGGGSSAGGGSSGSW